MSGVRRADVQTILVPSFPALQPCCTTNALVQEDFPPVSPLFIDPLSGCPLSSSPLFLALCLLALCFWPFINVFERFL